MQFTSGKGLATVPSPSREASAVPIENGSFVEGLRVLLDLTRNVRLPQTTEAERLALAALASIDRRDRMDDRAVALTEELSRYVELASEAKVRQLLQWIEGRFEPMPRRLFLRRSRARFVLLFVLLAKTIAPEERFGVLRTLNKLGYWGNQARLDRLLSAACPMLPLPAATRTATEYIKLAAAVIIDERERASGTMRVMPERFMTWPWARQLLYLVAWRRSDSTAATNPVFEAGSTEYSLARARAFTPLVLRGRAVAWRILRELGYSDFRGPSIGWPTRRLTWSALFLVAALAIAAVGVSRVHSWHDRNLRLATLVGSTYATTGDALVTPDERASED